MKIHQTETLGAVEVILKADSLEEGVRIVNQQQYGNGASIYTKNGYHARTFKRFLHRSEDHHRAVLAGAIVVRLRLGTPERTLTRLQAVAGLELPQPLVR